jgi:hypothetical protein
MAAPALQSCNWKQIFNNADEPTKPEGKRPCRRPMCRWEKILEWIFEE